MLNSKRRGGEERIEEGLSHITLVLIKFFYLFFCLNKVIDFLVK